MLSTRFTKLIASACFISAHTLWAAAPVVPVNAQNLFLPKGFDDNDQSTAVLDGYLPNSCYRFDRVEATPDHVTKTITVQAFARVYPGLCLMMIVPYTAEVSLGVLPAGDYRVVTNSGSTVKNLKVEESRNAGPDDFLYVPIDKAHVEHSENSYTAILEGRFTNTCMKFKEVKVIYTGETIQVLPLMEVEEGAHCESREIPFRKGVGLNVALAGRYLLHVRSLNGRASNTTFDVFETSDWQ